MPPTDFASQLPRLNELGSNLRELNLPDPVLLAKKRSELLAEYDVYRWFVPLEYGGFGWDVPQIVKGYLELSSACLPAAFVLTQRSGAVSRLNASGNLRLKEKLLPQLADGSLFSTIGISHLTTSRRHLGKPVLTAQRQGNGFVLDGFSPWVTGVTFADSVVVGATCENGDEILIHVPTDLPGVERPEPPELIELNDSCTGPIHFQRTFVNESNLVAGPRPGIMNQGSGGNTGGLQTSTLALGLARAAIEYLEDQSSLRDDFHEPAGELRGQFIEIMDYLMRVAQGDPDCNNESLRTRANSLVLRSTQAALMVAKGAGYCKNHPVGKYCQQALFFLVWSCPQPVAHANLCELAQIS